MNCPKLLTDKPELKPKISPRSGYEAFKAAMMGFDIFEGCITVEPLPDNKENERLGA